MLFCQKLDLELVTDIKFQVTGQISVTNWEYLSIKKNLKIGNVDYRSINSIFHLDYCTYNGEM